MYLRCNRRIKDGKEHRYWNIVENKRCGGGKVVQRQVLYLGEINDSQREAWEREYAEAHTRFEQHMKQITESREAEAAAAAEAPAGGAPVSSGSTQTQSAPATSGGGQEPAGTLATDEALAALREKLAGGKS